MSQKSDRKTCLMFFFSFFSSFFLYHSEIHPKCECITFDSPSFNFELSLKSTEKHHSPLLRVRLLNNIIYVCVMWECDVAHYLTSAGSVQPKSCFFVYNCGVLSTLQHFVQFCLSVLMVIQYFVHGACVGVNPFTIEISKFWIKCVKMCSFKTFIKRS